MGVAPVDVVRPHTGGVAPLRATGAVCVSWAHVIVRFPLKPAEDPDVTVSEGLGEKGSVRLVNPWVMVAEDADDATLKSSTVSVSVPVLDV